MLNYLTMSQISISQEFYESGNDNFAKKRFNAATDSYFKAIVTLCDHIIQANQGLTPKNHIERFDLMKVNYPREFIIVSGLFSRYRQTYNQKADENDAKITKEKFKELVKQFRIDKDFKDIL